MYSISMLAAAAAVASACANPSHSVSSVFHTTYHYDLVLCRAFSSDSTDQLCAQECMGFCQNCMLSLAAPSRSGQIDLLSHNF